MGESQRQLSREDTIARAIWGQKLIEPVSSVVLANDAHALAKSALAALVESGYLEPEPAPDSGGWGYVCRTSDIQG